MVLITALLALPKTNTNKQQTNKQILKTNLIIHYLFQAFDLCFRASLSVKRQFIDENRFKYWYELLAPGNRKF